ncbi:AraC family transcriptional regulator [Pararhodobacter oceanensis]|uniref:AraC family transcriptional regulator n=1 Tax=Pararhodobacter oceanensis TaxID=2172121 RepID=A0A2T8HRK0_9RHOB|nr:AraC family transcriptional regulator [Pararhodobacter oceanensis]PVH28050.1 AraC family transcriptional regulator [Pararhodobacter oceanensis]
MSFKDMTHVIRATSLTGYREVMRELGVSPSPLLAQFAIDAALLDDADALLPMESVCGLLEASSRATRCPDLGLRIARHQDHDQLGVLGLVMKSASTPAEACSIVSRFIFVQGTAFRIEVQEPGLLVPDTVSVNFLIVGIAEGLQRQTLELTLGTSFQAGQQRDPFGKKIKAVSLPHSLGGAIGRYRDFFGLPVYENQPHAALHCDAAGWHMPIADAVPEVSQMIKEHLERNFPAPLQHPVPHHVQHPVLRPVPRMSDRVRVALRPLIGTPQANRDDVARVLAIHPRTLHRQLLAEGTSFQQIKDTIRKELALKYLTETNATLAQLSVLLGFPEQSALSRACRKWFDMPPTHIRNRGKAAGVG